jgi:hypothetical protein
MRATDKKQNKNGPLLHGLYFLSRRWAIFADVVNMGFSVSLNMT